MGYEYQNKEAANLVGLSNEEDDDKQYFRSIPDGYRFMPKDDELIVNYLKKEVEKEPLPRNKIRRIDIYKHHPQQLCRRDKDQREKEWYFFSRRDRKYPNGSRPTRQAAGGYWKPTGADTNVVHEGRVVGYKKALDFYEGRPQQNAKSRTDWKMHEYRILQHPQPLTKTKDTSPPNTMELDTVLCKMYRKTTGKKEDNNDDIIDDDDEAVVANDHQNTHQFNNEQPPPPLQLERVAEPPYNSGGGSSDLVQFTVEDNDNNIHHHFNNEQQPPPPPQQQQLERVAESPPYNFVTDNIPTLSTTTGNFVFGENGGQEEDGTLMNNNNIQIAGEDYYHYPPLRSSPVRSFEGFDELGVVFRHNSRG